MLISSSAEQKLLTGIQRDLFSPEGLDLFVKEVSRLLAERSRQRQPERDQAQHRLIEVEKELANITKAITMGFVTATTKTALMNAEAERTRLQEIITASEEQADKVVTLLPRAREPVPGPDRGDRDAVCQASPAGPRGGAGVSRRHLVDADEGGLSGSDPHRTVCGTGDPAK